MNTYIFSLTKSQLEVHQHALRVLKEHQENHILSVNKRIDYLEEHYSAHPTPQDENRKLDLISDAAATDIACDATTEQLALVNKLLEGKQQDDNN